MECLVVTITGRKMIVTYIYKDKTQVVFVRMERRKLFFTVSSLNFRDLMLMERRKLFFTVSSLNFMD